MDAEAHGILFGKQLVIFGCGYVGLAVAQAAQSLGATVTALTRNADRRRALESRGIATVSADLAGETWYDLVPAAPEFAVNTVSAGGGGAAGYRHSYVDGMRSLARWTQRRGRIGTLVYTSSTSVYPQGNGERVEETAPVAAVTERGRLLVEAETVLQAVAPTAWNRWFILRLAGIYGPDRHHLLDQVRAGVVSGNPTHHLNMVHRDDIAAAILACLSAPSDIANEIFNVADDAPATKADVIGWLASKLGVAAPTFTGQPIAGREAVVPDRIIVNRKLKQRLRWQPRYPTFREGYATLAAGGAAT